jgi:hypothetical protein
MVANSVGVSTPFHGSGARFEDVSVWVVLMMVSSSLARA